MRTMVARLMPKASSPIRASPESLSRMRLYAGIRAGSGRKRRRECKGRGRSRPGPGAWPQGLLALGGGHLRGDLGREVVDLLLDALTDHVEREALHAGGRGLEHLAHGLLAVGGLDDTVQNWDAVHSTGNGFKFGPYNAQAFAESIYEALFAYADPESRLRIQRNGMAIDNSWENAARKYVELYSWTLS